MYNIIIICCINLENIIKGVITLPIRESVLELRFGV